MSRKIERELQRILALVEPKLARAFVAAMNDVATKADIKALIAAVRDNDVEAAIRAIGIDRSAFVGVYERLFEATALTGEAVAAGTIWRGINGERINIRFDMYNARAVDRLQNHTSRFVTNITNTAREVVRETISNGYSAGRGPIDIATDLVGRVTPRGRQGGSIGLSRTYEQWSSNMRSYLEEGNVSAYKGMSLRDKRYDKMVERGNLTAAQKNKIIERYNDRLLKSRANAIARTETAEAVESSQAEAFAQYQDKSGVEDQFIIRQWDHVGSVKGARDWHLEMNGTQVRGLQQPFITPRGAAMMHPLDTSLGAGAVEIVNCRCAQTITIDYKAMAQARNG